MTSNRPRIRRITEQHLQRLHRLQHPRHLIPLRLDHGIVGLDVSVTISDLLVYPFQGLVPELEEFSLVGGFEVAEDSAEGKMQWLQGAMPAR